MIHKAFLTAALSLLVVFAATDLSASEWEELLEKADSISEAGYHDSAAVVGYRALEVAEREYTSQDTVLAFVLEKLGNYLYKFSNHEEAYRLFRRSLSIREAASGSDDPGVAVSLYGLAGACQGMGLYEDTRKHYERALAIRENLYGPDHEDVAQVLVGLANLHREKLEVYAAESLLVRALEIYETVYGPDHKLVGHVLTRLAVAKIGKMDMSAAGEYFERAMRILFEKLGPDHPDNSQLISTYGFFLAGQGMLDEADSLARLALEITQRARGENHIEVARRLYVVGFIAVVRGDYLEAEKQLRHALDISETTLGPEHSLTGRLQNVLANVYRQLGKHDKADSLYQRSLEVVERSMGQKSMDAADGLMNVAMTAMKRGSYAEAESLLVECLDVFDQTFGLDHPDATAPLRSLGTVYFNQGRYAEAELMFDRALEVCDSSAGTGQMQAGATLQNIANIRLLQGRYDESESLLMKAAEVLEQALGEGHPLATQCVENVAVVNLKTGNLRKADSLAEHIIATLEDSERSEHEEVVAMLAVRGEVASREGRYDEAEGFFTSALTMAEKVLGSANPQVAVNLDNLAELYAHMGDYDEADRFHKIAYEIRTEAMGTEHPLVAEGMETYSALQSLKGDWPEALRLSREAFNIRRRNFETNGYSLAEVDALLFSQNIRQSADRHVSCFFDSRTADIEETRMTSDVIVSSKGQVSDMIFERRKPLIEETDPGILALADSLRAVQFQLSALFIEGPGNDTTDSYKHRLDSLQNLADEVETELAQLSASFRNHKEQKNVDTDRIISLLPENAVLIEYFKYNHITPLSDSVEPRYAAALLSRNSTPMLINLGMASDIDGLVDSYRRHMIRVSSQQDGPGVFDAEDYSAICSSLYEKIWQPVADQVAAIEMIIVAPDGGLNMISFAGLKDGAGRYLVEDHAIHYLSSGRDLVRMQESQVPGDGLFALGDPDYDASMTASDIAPGSDGNRIRNARSNCGELDNLKVARLPGTRSEVEQLSLSWRDNTDEVADVYFGKDASEENFKSNAPGHRVIHLATHGYFLEGLCNPDIPSAYNRADNMYVRENPLLLSGLMLAGANRTMTDSIESHFEDGILTAYEVSSMKLDGTELVVLSACETGLGEVESGEGVYGLRRAFQMAGTSTVISALWPVADKPTAEMMSSLYTGSGESLADKMRLIQLGKIEELRENGKPDHPYSWGGFVALGDWRW